MLATPLFNKLPFVTAIFTSALDVILLFLSLEPIDILEFLFTKLTVLVLLVWLAVTLPWIFIPPEPSLETNKVDLFWVKAEPPDAIKPVDATSKPPFVLVIFVAPLGFETSPAIEMPLAPEFSIVILPVP